jgi:asparaginyl-tRNA synthetase
MTDTETTINTESTQQT